MGVQEDLSGVAKRSTKERILEAALDLFSEKGFNQVTISEISGAADVNIAAVNYHFGSKENLYEAVWREALAYSRKAFFTCFGRESELSAEELLFSFIESRVNATFCCERGGSFPCIMHREMTEPTFAFAQIKEEVVKPSRMWLEARFRDLLAEGTSDDKLRLFVFSLASQLGFLNIHDKAGRIAGLNKDRRQINLEDIRNHIFDVLMAAVREHNCKMEEQKG